jgi:hypothetical protein
MTDWPARHVEYHPAKLQGSPKMSSCSVSGAYKYRLLTLGRAEYVETDGQASGHSAARTGMLSVCIDLDPL